MSETSGTPNTSDGYGAGVPDLPELAPPLHRPSLEAVEVSERMLEVHWRTAELHHRFPEMVRLPGRWYRHNERVGVLQALHDHERAAFAPTPPLTVVAGWHITFRDLEARLRDSMPARHITPFFRPRSLRREISHPFVQPIGHPVPSFRDLSD
jgi:hypothetical protein